MNKSEFEKEDLEFYKGISDKLGIALHINEIIDHKYLKTLWGNDKYIVLLGKSIEERNKDIEKHHREFCVNNDFTDIKKVLQSTLENNKSYSALYKHQSQAGSRHWLLTLAKPFK